MDPKNGENLSTIFVRCMRFWCRAAKGCCYEDVNDTYSTHCRSVCSAVVPKVSSLPCSSAGHSRRRRCIIMTTSSITLGRVDWNLNTSHKFMRRFQRLRWQEFAERETNEEREGKERAREAGTCRVSFAFCAPVHRRLSCLLSGWLSRVERNPWATSRPLQIQIGNRDWKSGVERCTIKEMRWRMPSEIRRKTASPIHLKRYWSGI